MEYLLLEECGGRGLSQGTSVKSERKFHQRSQKAHCKPRSRYGRGALISYFSSYFSPGEDDEMESRVRKTAGTRYGGNPSCAGRSWGRAGERHRRIDRHYLELLFRRRRQRNGGQSQLDGQRQRQLHRIRDAK